MKKTIRPLAILSLALFLASCNLEEGFDLDNQLQDKLQLASQGKGTGFFLQPDAGNLAAIPADPKNPITPAKVKLGQLLYHEPGIGNQNVKAAGAGTYSCASCHFARAGFQAGRLQGIGEGGAGVGVRGEARIPMFSHYTGNDLDVQPIRTPTALNTAYQELMLWNGQFGATNANQGLDYAFDAGTPKETNKLGFQGLETQAIAGLKVHRMLVSKEVVEKLGYKDMFDQVFGDVPATERYTNITTGLAIAAYERTLFANQSPFQRWLRGDRSGMTGQQKKGAVLFFGKANCSSCHSGPALSSMEFHAIGMEDLYKCPEETFKTSAYVPENLGRGGFTRKAADMHKFKVPQLYNLADSPFYGHGSTFRTVREVIEYKNKAVVQKTAVPKSQLASAFVPLKLTEEEINQLTAFIEGALHDPNLARYEPTSLPSGNCFPFNDPLSRQHQGCD